MEDLNIMDMAPPPAVVEFAEKHNCKDVRLFNQLKYKDSYNVYIAIDKNDEMQYYVILSNGKEVRFATDEEAIETTDRFY